MTSSATLPQKGSAQRGMHAQPGGNRPHQAPTEVQPHEERTERDHRGDQRVLEHRHLDDHAAHSLWRLAGDLEGDVGAERRPADHGFVDVEMVQERDRVAANDSIEYSAMPVGAVGTTVPERVEREHVRAGRRERDGEVLLHQRGDEQPGHEQHPALALTEFGVRQAMTPAVNDEWTTSRRAIRRTSRELCPKNGASAATRSRT